MDAAALHRDALVIDSHNDAIVSLIRRGNLSLAGPDVPHPHGHEGTIQLLRGPLEPHAYAWNGQTDLPKLREGGIDCAFFAVDVTRAWKNHLAYALDAFGYLLEDLRSLDGAVVIARTAGEVAAAKRDGKIAIVLVIENSESLEGSLHVLQALFHLGVRSLVLTHNWSTWAAAGNAEHDSGGGLTRFGIALVKEMDRLGMLIDVSHIAERGFWDTLAQTTRPVIASHSCCAALCPQPRNLTDEQLRALGAAGGVVGITFVPYFLDPKWKETDWPQVPSLEVLLNHIEHAAEVAGIDHVGIGSDFDGGGTVLPHYGAFPRITEGLLARGFCETDVRKVLGENTLRLLTATLG
jgi:membrane dipeptidase